MSRARARCARWLPALVVLRRGDRRLGGARAASFDIAALPAPAPSAIAQTFWDEQRALWHAGLVHVPGGARRVRHRLLGRVRRRARVARLRTARRTALMPLRDRRERDPDHRVRSDHERLVRPLTPCVQDRDRRRAVLLPGDGEHAAGPDVGAAVGDRADALVRCRRGDDLPPRPAAELSPVRLLGVEGRDRLAMIGADRGRLLRRLARALGVQIRRTVGIFDVRPAWAGIVLASLLGIALLRGRRARRATARCAGIPRSAERERVSRSCDGIGDETRRKKG